MTAFIKALKMVNIDTFYAKCNSLFQRDAGRTTVLLRSNVVAVLNDQLRTVKPSRALTDNELADTDMLFMRRAVGQ